MPRKRPKAPPDLLIRVATDADRAAVARCWIDGWRSTGIRLAAEPTFEELRFRVDVDLAAGWRLIVAELDATVVGFVALRPDLAKLDQIFVAPAVHGQGVGQALFAAARAAMPDGFSLWTHGENARAQRFYDALQPIGQEHGVHPKAGHPIITYRF